MLTLTLLQVIEFCLSLPLTLPPIPQGQLPHLCYLFSLQKSNVSQATFSDQPLLELIWLPVIAYVLGCQQPPEWEFLCLAGPAVFTVAAACLEHRQEQLADCLGLSPCATPQCRRPLNETGDMVLCSTYNTFPLTALKPLTARAWTEKATWQLFARVMSSVAEASHVHQPPVSTAN